MNLPSSSVNNSVSTWSLNHLQNKIELVQEILTRLELLLKTVNAKLKEMERRFDAQVRPVCAIMIQNTAVARPPVLGKLKQWGKVIEDIINQYCAFENILRTVEENQQIEGNVLLLFPDLSRLDNLMDTLQKATTKKDWNSIKQKVEEFNHNSKKPNVPNPNGDVVPVISRLLQVRYEPRVDSRQQGAVFGEGNHTTFPISVGKRTLSTENAVNPPTKLLKVSYRKDDIAAATAVQTSPLSIARSLCGPNNGKDIVEVVEIGSSEENRLLPQSNSTETLHVPTYNYSSASSSHNSTTQLHYTTQHNYNYNPSNQNVYSGNSYHQQPNASQTPSCSRNMNYGYQTMDRVLGQNGQSFCSNNVQYGRNDPTSSSRNVVYNLSDQNSSNVNYNYRAIDRGLTGPNNQNFNHSNFQIINQPENNLQYRNPNLIQTNFNNNYPNQPMPHPPQCAPVINNTHISISTQPTIVNSYSLMQPSVNDSHNQYYNSNLQNPVFGNNVNCSARRPSLPTYAENINPSLPSYTGSINFTSSNTQPYTNTAVCSNGIYNVPTPPTTVNNNGHLNVPNNTERNMSVFTITHVVRNNQEHIQIAESENEVQIIDEVSVTNRDQNAGVPSRPNEDHDAMPTTSTHVSNRLNGADEYASLLKKLLAERKSSASNINNNDNTLTAGTSIGCRKEDVHFIPQRPTVIQKSPLSSSSSPIHSSFMTVNLKKNIESLLKDSHSQHSIATAPCNAPLQCTRPQIDPAVIEIEKLNEASEKPIEFSFESLKIKEKVLNSIKSYNYLTPWPVQIEGIRALLDGKDVIVKSKGSGGKTSLAIIAMLAKIDTQLYSTQAIIVTTKESSFHVQKKISSTSAITDIKAVCADDENDSKAKNPSGHILVGSPEKVLHSLQKTNFRISTVKTLVIDAADKLLLLRDGLGTLIRILYALDGSTQVAMLVTEKTDEVVAFSKRLRAPLHIESLEADCNKEDITENSDVPAINRSFSKSVDLDQTSSTSKTSLNDSTSSNCPSLPEQRLEPKYTLMIKSIKPTFVLVEVRAEGPNGEMELMVEEEEVPSPEPALDLDLYRAMDFDDDVADPEEDPLAISDEEKVKSVEELNPREFARRVKTQEMLQKNQNFVVAFPEDIRKMLEDLSAKAEKESVSTQSPKSEAFEPEESNNNNAMINRQDFLKKKHFHVVMEEDDEKIATLALLNMEQEKTIIFCNTIERAEWLSSRLRQKSMLPQVLHENVKKKDRETILKSFFEMGFSRILIATDFLTQISSSGNSTGNVPLVINYDMPNPPSAYVWRSRYACSNSGSVATMVVSFINEKDLTEIKNIEETYGLRIAAMMDDSPPHRSSVDTDTEDSCSDYTPMDLENPD